MTADPAGQLWREIALPDGVVRRSTEKEGGGVSVILRLFGRCIERDHLRLVDPLEMIERADRARVEPEAVKENRFVFGEKAEVVAQDDEVVFLDLCVGGIGVLDVDRAVGERRVTDRVIDSADVRHR